jgi:hypothetical protein
MNDVNAPATVSKRARPVDWELAQRQAQVQADQAREQSEASRRTLELTAQGQATDRFTRAVEQLGASAMEVRIGGIYALERIARDSAADGDGGDHPAVMAVLAAFVRALPSLVARAPALALLRAGAGGGGSAVEYQTA